MTTTTTATTTVDSLLSQCTYECTPAFCLSGTTTLCRVLDVYDGDTVTLAVPMHGTVYSFASRMEGIDTCEMKSKTPFCVDRAFRARNRLAQLCSGSTDAELPLDNRWPRAQLRKFLQGKACIVTALCGEFDKYGRLLSRLSVQAEDFATVLLREKLAYRYDGATKPTESEIEALLTIN